MIDTARPVALEIRLLGPLVAAVDGRRIAPPASRRAWALLGFLALSPGPLLRGQVAAALWPAVRDASARASLRSAAWALRRALGGAAAQRMVATHELIGLVDDGGLWTDVRAFAAAAEAGRHERALRLYRGPLLQGVEDDWALAERDAFEDQLSAALGALTLEALERGDRERAVRWARRRVSAAPRDEPAARALMVALSAAGEPAAALEVHRRLAGRLRRELGVDQAPATRELAARIRAGGGLAAAARMPRPLLQLLARDVELAATYAPRAPG